METDTFLLRDIVRIRNSGGTIYLRMPPRVASAMAFKHGDLAAVEVRGGQCTVRKVDFREVAVKVKKEPAQKGGSE